MQLRTYLASDNPFLLSPQIRKKTVKSNGKVQKINNSAVPTSSTNEGSSLLQSTKSNNFSSLYSSFSQLIETSESDTYSNRARAAAARRSLTFRRKKSAISNEEIEGNIHELEVIDLASEFLGNNGKVLYQTSLMLLTYIGLLAYTQVFNSSFREQIWPSAPALLPQIFFAAIVVPLSCFDLSEQVVVQVAMSILRFVSLGILLFGTIAALILNPRVSQPIHSDLQTLSPSSSFPSPALLPSSPLLSDLPLVNWSGFGMMFTTAIFSQLFQHSVPALIRPLSNEDKRKIPSIFLYALCTTAAIYISTGIACVAYFKNDLNQSVNLNFVGFTWGLQGEHPVPVTILAMIVVLFPALDTLSVFPLIANTLGNNFNSAFPVLKGTVKWILYDRVHAQQQQSNSGMSETRSNIFSFEQQPNQQEYRSTSAAGSSGGGGPAMAPSREQQREQAARVHKVTIVLWRLLAAVPPIIASSLVTDLILSLQIAGLCGIVVALVTPALLERKTAVRFKLLLRLYLPFCCSSKKKSKLQNNNVNSYCFLGKTVACSVKLAVWFRSFQVEYYWSGLLTLRFAFGRLGS